MLHFDCDVKRSKVIYFPFQCSTAVVEYNNFTLLKPKYLHKNTYNSIHISTSLGVLCTVYINEWRKGVTAPKLLTILCDFIFHV
jgi:hypothetical protein